MRESKEQVTFKGLLWLAAQGSPINPIDAKLTSFASLPEGFDKEKTITLYVYTLSLDFGVDVREFWPSKVIDGDFDYAREFVEGLGLKYNDAMVKAFVDPTLYRRSK